MPSTLNHSDTCLAGTTEDRDTFWRTCNRTVRRIPNSLAAYFHLTIHHVLTGSGYGHGRRLQHLQNVLLRGSVSQGSRGKDAAQRTGTGQSERTTFQSLYTVATVDWLETETRYRLINLPSNRRSRGVPLPKEPTSTILHRPSTSRWAIWFALYTLIP